VSAIRLACFDLDGTLVDSTADIRAALAYALAEVGPADPAHDEAALAQAGLGHPLEEFFALARPASHPASDATSRARFIAAYRAHYHAHLLDKTRPFPGVIDTLGALTAHRSAGLRLAVATTKRSDTAVRVISGLGLHPYFDLVLGTDGIPHKPAPDLLLLAARRLERSPADGLMVGDTERDIQAGRAAGMRTCGVAWGATGRARLHRAEADHVIEHFAEVVTLL
jgi:phosphoglycolate phosphatase